MKPFIYIGIMLLFTACTTQKKATAWFENHPEQDAQRCSIKYPARDSLHVTVDTAKYEQMVHDLLGYADSVTMAAEARNKAIAAAHKYIDSLKEAGDYSESVAQALADKLNAIKPTDVQALTRSIEAKVRASTKPCHDSLIIRVDGAQHVYDSLRGVRLAGDSSSLVQMKHDRKQVGTVLGWLLADLLGKWWFWLILVLVALYLFRKPIAALLKVTPI